MTVRAELAADTPWAPAGHVVAHTQFAVAPRRATGAPRPARATVGARCATPSSTPRTGRLRRLFGLDVDGPRLELWRAPTDNDRGVANDSPDGRSAESRWRERGLDRLVHRLVAVDPDGPVVRVRTGAAGSARTVDVTYRWHARRRGHAAGRGGALARLGLHLAAGGRPVRPAADAAARPLVRHRAARVVPRLGARRASSAASAADLDELNVRYSRPQETGHRPQLRTLEIADDDAASASGCARCPARRPPPRLHPHPAHAAGGGPGPAPARAAAARPAPTCSSTTPCTAWARPPAASTSPRSTACGPARGRSRSCSRRRSRDRRSSALSEPERRAPKARHPAPTVQDHSPRNPPDCRCHSWA